MSSGRVGILSILTKWEMKNEKWKLSEFSIHHLSILIGH